MQHQRTRYGYALKLDSGEEIVGSLTAFAADQSVRAGAISGIGSVGETVLGFYVRATGAYARRTFHGEHEIGALMGNFSELDGKPYPHCHIQIAGEDFVAHTGHLFSGLVTVTCEIQVVTDPGVMRRVREPLGYSLLDLRG
jgi:predicted DNA-binding protein with PD1-like motif